MRRWPASVPSCSWNSVIVFKKSWAFINIFGGGMGWGLRVANSRSTQGWRQDKFMEQRWSRFIQIEELNRGRGRHPHYCRTHRSSWQSSACKAPSSQTASPPPPQLLQTTGKSHLQMLMPLRKRWGRRVIFLLIMKTLHTPEPGEHRSKPSRTRVGWNEVRVFWEETWTFPDLASAEQSKSNSTKFKAAWIQCGGKKFLVYQRILWRAYKDACVFKPGCDR